MNTLASNSQIDDYFIFMKYWNNEQKNQMISKLSASMNTNIIEKSDFSNCFGKWEDKRSADEIILELRNSRINQIEIEEF